MGKNSNTTKQDQLGMSYGTACHKLRKSIMFQLVKETNRDSCFKCGEKISNLDDLTIEHKIPWLHGDIELFWDLSNIAFSHAKCNKADRQNPTHKLPEAPEGKSWCTGHQEFLPIENFHKNKTKRFGLQYECKDCRKVRPSSL